jgi:hypothetical protein
MSSERRRIVPQTEEPPMPDRAVVDVIEVEP